MRQDSEATRQRILEAAVVEFAEHGIAGARVDRIATAAESNKQLIYQYFGNKEGLFHTVLVQELARATEGVPLPPDDVEGYAGAYFDFAMANPRVMRLIAWCGLEAKRPVAGVGSAKSKLDLIAAAQQSRKVSDRFSPEFILSTISAVCTAWVPSNWYGSQLDPDAATNAARYRESIVRLVGMMIRPDPKP
ncbi:TetR/AcrR family transcriptional regulator [Nostoc sp.]|uniref:TetR/AcrR family transcriptional regulator n=1 Tax=Nostoc sp. TaxID=1180 RepID=UPI002FF97CC7